MVVYSPPAVAGRVRYISRLGLPLEARADFCERRRDLRILERPVLFDDLVGAGSRRFAENGGISGVLFLA